MQHFLCCVKCNILIAKYCTRTEVSKLWHMGQTGYLVLVFKWTCKGIPPKQLSSSLRTCTRLFSLLLPSWCGTAGFLQHNAVPTSVPPDTPKIALGTLGTASGVSRAQWWCYGGPWAQAAIQRALECATWLCVVPNSDLGGTAEVAKTALRLGLGMTLGAQWA